MNTCFEDLDPQETEVLKEAVSDGTRRPGPRPEYAAELRRRVLTAAVAKKAVRDTSSRPIWLGSILGTAIAVGLLILAWSVSGEPAWAAAIRRAREQAWIHARVEHDGGGEGDFWVSPDRDIVAARLGGADFIFDYKHGTFLRYDSKRNIVYRASGPEDAGLAQELSSVADLAAVFRRSSSATELLPNDRIEGWRLLGQVIDGVPCDEYEIVVQTPSRGLTTRLATLSLAIDRQAFLPRALTVSESEGPKTTLRFDYPSSGPTDERWLGIPASAVVIDVDPTRRVAAIAESLREARQNFDDYTALCVTSSAADPSELVNCEVRRLLRRGAKWRFDKVRVSDRKLSLPSDPALGLKAWQAMQNRFRYEPVYICDGQTIRRYQPRSLRVTGGQLSQPVRLSDETQKDSAVPPIFVPERCCRPILGTGALDHFFGAPSKTVEGNRELLKIVVSSSLNVAGKEAAPDTYLLDPSRGNVAVREVIHTVPRATATGVVASSAQEIEFKEFRCSPNGYWYPALSIQDDADKSARQTTRFYVDFADVPSDELFRASD